MPSVPNYTIMCQGNWLPSQASRAYPDLYASEQAAAKVLKPVTDHPTFSIEGLYGKGWVVVELKVPRAKDTTRAILPHWVRDPRAEIKRHLPNAELISDQAEAQAIPIETANRPIGVEQSQVTHPAEVISINDIPEQLMKLAAIQTRLRKFALSLQPVLQLRHLARHVAQFAEAVQAAAEHRPERRLVFDLSITDNQVLAAYIAHR